MIALLLLGVFAVFMSTMAPSVTVGDSGELVTAAYSIGVAHPPGYPLYVILAKLASVIVPFGSIAFRINVFSAICGAAAAAVAAVWLSRLDPLSDKRHSASGASGARSTASGRLNGLVAALGGAMVAFARTLFQQAIMAEVYTLLMLLILVLFWVFEKMSHRPVAYSALAACAMGLCLMHHQSTALLLPAFGLMAWRWRSEWSWEKIAEQFLLAGLMGCLFLMLPLRSLANPDLDWGNPETLSNFLHTILRRQYKVTTGETRHVAEWFGQLAVWLKWQVGEMGWEVIILAILGFFYCGLGIGDWGLSKTIVNRQSTFGNREDGWVMLMLWVGVGVGVCAVGNFRLMAFDKEVVEVFWIPCNIAMAWWVTVAAKRLAGKVGWMAPIGLAALLGWQGWANAASLKHLKEPMGYWHGENMLKVPEHPFWLFVAAEDNDIFPVAYGVLVEGRGDRQRVLDDLGCVITRAYGDDFKWLTEPEQLLRMKKLQGAILQQSADPKYFTLAAHMGNIVLELPDQGFMPVGLLYRVVEVEKGWQGQPMQGRQLTDRLLESRGLAREAWRRYATVSDATGEVMVGWDVFSRTVVGRYTYMLSEHELAAGRPALALRWGRQTALLGYDISWMHNSLGNLFARYGFREFAMASYRRVIELEPKRAEPHTNLGGIFLGEGRNDDAIRELTLAIQKNPSFIAAYTNLGVAYKNKGDSETAKKVWRQGLVIDPDNVPLRLNLERTP